MKKRPSKDAFDFTSGHLCLDFVNTVDHRLSSLPQELLTGFAELVQFGEESRAVSAPEARNLQREGRKRVREVSAFFRRAVAVREVIFRIFSAVAEDCEVPDADLKNFNAAVRRSNAHSLVMPRAGKTAWQWLDKSADAYRLVGKIVRSAVELLTSGDIQRVKQCAAGDCGWLFIDDSRSQNRRWCEMKTCGSRHKAHAYYQRKKAARRRISGRTHSAK